MTALVDDQSKKPFRDDQIVVDAQQQAHVREVLHSNGIDVEEKDSIARLGLTLLQVTDPTSMRPATDGLRRQDPLRRFIDGARALRGQPAATEADIKDLEDLDILLFFLRHHFASRYHGWPITVAKHRSVRGTHGMGEINGGVPKPVVASGAGFLAPKPGVTSFDWKNSPAGKGVRVALLDTPVLPHPRMIKNLVGGYDAFLDRSRAYPSPKAGHGTFSASRILSAAPSATVLLRPVLDEFGEGSAWDVAKALAELLDEAVDIVVLPFGCETDDGEPPLLLTRAIDPFTRRMIVLAAGGNYDEVQPPGLPRPIFPAGLAGVVAVGAEDKDGKPAPFSPSAPWLTTRAGGVDIPGLFLPGTVPVTRLDGTTQVVTHVGFGGLARLSGSSAAVADVAGSVAAALGKARAIPSFPRASVVS